jgi:organic hydroperoxide reductase OsmC/OhrA
MPSSTLTLHWERQAQPFLDQRYSRRHRWSFDGGIEVAASASPEIVPLPMSAADAVDPEEAFVASLSSCHLLWFLSLAAKAGYVVDRYEDRPVGVMGRNAAGKMAMSTVTLRPRVTFSGARIPDAAALADLHHQAHEACFIASSVLTTVTCEPQV